MIAKPSKSALKREYLALQALGEHLIELTTDQLQSIGLEESLLDAVLAAKAITAHGAMRRQNQLIGKIMRDTDPEPIRAAIDVHGNNDRFENQVFRDAERWRDRLTASGGDDLDQFFELIGHRSDQVARAVADWFSAPGDRQRKLARRQIFREIHKELTSKMQSTASSL